MTPSNDAPTHDADPAAELLARAMACHQEWRFDEARVLYEEVLQIDPQQADAHHNLGVLLAVQLLRAPEALPHFEAALNADAGNPQFWFSYIDALIRSSQDALARQLLPLARAQGLAQADANGFEQRMMQASREQPAAAGEPAAVPLDDQARLAHFFRQQDYVQGETLARQLTQRHPQAGFAWKALGVMLQPQGKKEAALQAKQRAAELLPDDAESFCNLGSLLQEMGHYPRAVAALERALQLKPDYAEALNNLGLSWQKLGQTGRALTHLRRALHLQPDDERIHSNYLFTLNYEPDLPAGEIYAAYEEYDRRFGQPHRADWRAHDNAAAAGRRLKVGYVSPDFRQHACMHFAEPLLSHHDRSRFEVYAYAELGREDAVTQRYKRSVDHWVVSRGMSDQALAERIRADGIDILVDLAGHTAGNRLGVFARKPAPVSLSWMGYGYTSGLKAIDYYLSDEVNTPMGSEPLFSETPWRLAGCPYAYRPAEGMGEVSELPALRRGHITFGTLTRAVRINHRTVRVWSEILKRVPGSELVIDSVSYKDEGVWGDLLGQFEAQGIGAERLRIGYHSPPWDVLRDIDIGLDCFPHNSGTTLFESLYLGVPFITLAGRPSVGRLGSAILHGIGCAQWVADSEADYVERAVALAGDSQALAGIRAGLRAKMQASRVMDEGGFAREVEQAYQQMFQRWEDNKT